MKVNGPGRSKVAQKRIFWQLAKHAWLYSNLLKGRTFASSGFSTEGLNFCVRKTPLRADIQESGVRHLHEAFAPEHVEMYYY